MTLPICPFDNLHIRILHEIFILIILALKVVAIEVVGGVVVVAVVELNVELIVVLVVACTYCLLVR